MIELQDGLARGGRCNCGMKIGWISSIGNRTYTICWIDGETTTQLRPDLDEDYVEPEPRNDGWY